MESSCRVTQKSHKRKDVFFLLYKTLSLRLLIVYAVTALRTFLDWPFLYRNASKNTTKYRQNWTELVL